MPEALKLSQDVVPDVQIPGLISMPTGAEVAKSDPFAQLRELLGTVVVKDYRVRTDGTGPIERVVPNAVIVRGESDRLANGIYSIVPKVSAVPEI